MVLRVVLPGSVVDTVGVDTPVEHREVEDRTPQHRLHDRHRTRHQHRVVAADHLDILPFVTLPVGGGLFFRDRGGGVPGGLPVDRFPGGDPALEPAVVVPLRHGVTLLGDGRPFAVVEHPVFVALRPTHQPGVAAGAELEARRRRNREHQPAESRRERVEPWGTQPPRDATTLEVHRPADGVTLRLVLVDRLPHPLGRLRVATPHFVVLCVFEHLLKGDWRRLDVADLVDVRFHLHVEIARVEHLLCDRARGHPVDRLAGRRPATPTPVAGAELRGVGVVPVGGAGGGDERLVLPRPGVFVLDDHPDRRPGGVAVLEPGVDRHLVGLPPTGGDHRLAGFPSVELPLDVVFRQFDPRGHTRHRTPHRVPVALTVRRHLEQSPEAVAVHAPRWGLRGLKSRGPPPGLAGSDPAPLKCAGC